jgi:tetratricopeptide (TPR) repeat protein
MRGRLMVAVAAVSCWTGGALAAHAQDALLGTLSFPNSGNAAAQPFFIEGVKFLHSFEWTDAAEAFRKAQDADPAFALAYWGEALSFTGGHHFPPEQDMASARKALSKLGATRTERLAKAATPRERGYLEAVEILYGPGDAHERAVAHARAMDELRTAFPEDDEAATFAALAVMRTARRGEEALRTDMQAGAMALRVYRRNPEHPGAVHYIIHAFDEPSHAIVALEAADVYATLAPDAPHALHMPSHIYVQLGMWDKLSQANTRSYEASARRSERKQLKAIEGQAFHAMYWLHYAYLMQGDFARADQALALAGTHALAADSGPSRGGYFENMQARHVIETERWQKADLEPVIRRIRAAPDRAAARVLGASLLAVGLSAARLGDAPLADQSADALRSLLEGLRSSGAGELKPIEIMHLQVAGVAQLAHGRQAEGLSLLKEAVEIEESMDPPSGPPGEQETDPPLKPSHELYGEALLEAGRGGDASTQFAAGLLRTPNRPRLLLGAARAALKQGERVQARHYYEQLLHVPAAGPDLPGRAEATAFLKETPSAAGRP